MLFLLIVEKYYVDIVGVSYFMCSLYVICTCASHTFWLFFRLMSSRTGHVVIFCWLISLAICLSSAILILIYNLPVPREEKNTRMWRTSDHDDDVLMWRIKLLMLIGDDLQGSLVTLERLVAPALLVCVDLPGLLERSVLLVWSVLPVELATLETAVL